ncbi:hypothetical protein TNCV_5131431 [Trichonephila clavipes]|nr:hypothetical protein TNCV_5131431 [Trichonephila clavipes]
MAAFQTVLEKQMAFLMETLQKSMEAVISRKQRIRFDDVLFSPKQEKRASDTLSTTINPIQGCSGNSGKLNTEFE